MKRIIFAIIPIFLIAVFVFSQRNTTSAQSTSFVFTAAGDWGKKTETDKSLQAIVNSGSVFTLAVGDLSYQDGEGPNQQTG